MVADIKFLQLIWRLDSGRSRHPLPHCDFNAYDQTKPCNPRTIESIRLAYADKEFTDKENKDCGSFYGEPRWDIIQNLELVVPLHQILKSYLNKINQIQQKILKFFISYRYWLI